MSKTILITGAAKRIGASCARLMHAEGYTLIVHYQNSETEAMALVAELNAIRTDSAWGLRADLSDSAQLRDLSVRVMDRVERLDGLIHNASQFFPCEVADVDENVWNSLFNSNLKAPFFLTQALLPLLKQSQASVINMVDIYGQRPLLGHAVYSMTKAALIAMTHSLAKELAPDIRVNAVAPGAILWPESGHEQTAQIELLSKVALQRCGEPEDIAKAVRYLMLDAPYVTGQVLNIDGGRSLFI
ncbi:MAG: pteridine reductase [Methylococcaceae bacterium]|nr:pteridine reductase [Methylococcaceae bacterium]